MKTNTLPVVALGATLLFTSACGSPAGEPGPAGSAPPGAAASGDPGADNTARLCKSGGEAARTVVLDLFSQLAAAAKGNETPSQADLTRVYRSTFGKLRDDLRGAGAEATDPEFAAVLEAIATEADKLATTSDPESVGTEGFEEALGKLEKHCPSGTPGASPAPGGAAGGTVGAKGSACELPVSFAVAAKWQPKAVEFADGDPLAELGRKGTLRMACEISARPAGLTGFLRVWIGPATGDPRAALRALLTGAKIRKADYTPVPIGGRDGMELKYQSYSELMEEYSDRQAFAVMAPGGAVVVELSGLESGDPAMRAAYEQARSTLTVNP